MSNRRVGVIGAGPGGLAAAMLLASAGADVTVHERLPEVGGRSGTLVADAPSGRYNFDIGPTFFLYPQILEEIFSATGNRLADNVDLIRLDPQYRLVFEAGGQIDATPDPARMAAELARFSPADAEALPALHGRQPRAKLLRLPPGAGKPVQLGARPARTRSSSRRCPGCGRPNRSTPTFPATLATSGSGSPSPSRANTSACRRSGARACSRSFRLWNTSSASGIRAAAPVP